MKEIKIESDEAFQYVSADDIREVIRDGLAQKIYGVISRNNIILLSERKVKGEILNRFPSIRSVAVLKRIPALLIIKIEEREKVGIWCQARLLEIESRDEETEDEEKIGPEEASATTTQEETDDDRSIAEQYQRETGNCFLLGREGVIFQKTSLVTGSLILNIYDLRQDAAEMGQEMVSPPLLEFILDLKQKLPEIKKDGRRVFAENDFEIASVEDIRVKSSKFWQVYFNPLNSLDSQVEALQAFLDSGQEAAEYIDLRIDSRAYYK